MPTCAHHVARASGEGGDDGARASPSLYCSPVAPPDVRLDDEAIATLGRAAEEVAWLTGRGYPLAVAAEVVATHHALGPIQRSALDRGTCSEPQYRRRAARELEAEDIARRPLAVDARGTIAAVAAAIAGAPVLRTLDGTVRALAEDGAGLAVEQAAIDRIVQSVRALKASRVTWVLEVGADAEALGERLAATSKANKLAADVALVPSVTAALLRERQVVSAEAAVLDACAAWFNLSGRVVDDVPSATVLRLL